MFSKLFCYLLLPLSIHISALAKNNGCSELLNPVDIDLIQLRNTEMKKYSPRELKKMNSQLIKKMDSLPFLYSEKKATSISMNHAEQLIKILNEFPVVCPADGEKYQAEEEKKIGYCFGRATLVHLLLLKMGIDKNAILKAWVVGPHKSNDGQLDWGFHVAIMVQVDGYGWRLIDNGSGGRVYPLNMWFNAFNSYSTDKKMRLYITNAQKFGPRIAKYSPLELGLTVSKDKDWYRGYFRDLMAQLRGINIEDLGLKPVAHNPSKKPQKSNSGVLKELKDFFLW